MKTTINKMALEFIDKRIFKLNQFLIILSLVCFALSIYSCGSLKSSDWYSRLQAVYRIKNQDKLTKVFLEDVEIKVRRAAFNKLDNNSLSNVITLTKDPAVVVAAKIRLKQTSWKEAFNSNNKYDLGNAISAAALVTNPSPSSSDVVAACHKYIRNGDASKIPDLIFLLNKYGDVTLAEDYMNCGESSLETAGCNWGKAHGYSCTTGSGSNRVRWGQDK